jgi:Uma2 family endonuclease
VTAEPVGHVMWSPNPLRQRLANYTVEDTLQLPDDAPRVELSDGVMVLVPSPTHDHQDITGLLWHWLRRNVPDGLRASLSTGVALSLDTTYEPDVLLVNAEVARNRHYTIASQVVLVVEVVSPSTRKRDRLEKPADYAAAGIPHFWRIEQDPLHIFAYDLVGGSYELVADSAQELVLNEPFEIRLPIRDIAP